MEDQQIVELFRKRSEVALLELDRKYRRACKRVAYNILRDEQDAEECINDSYMAVWNTIPPKQPENLATYLCRITRNLSLKKYHYNTASKRNHYYDEVLDEIEGYIVPRNVTEEEILKKEIVAKINEFLGSLKKQERVIFVKRYWFCATPKEIAKEQKVSSNYVNVCLHRTRKQLKKYLERENLI